MIAKELQVVEVANVLAGPAVGMFFAELGARVIKVENKTSGGDITRQWKLPNEDAHSSVSAYYCSTNWNKEVVFADLGQTEDRDKVYDLIREADIVISNYKQGDDRKLGMDYQTLTSLKPDLIYGHISGFGEMDSRPAFDIVLQAETGFLSMNGSPESGPVKMPVALIDVLAAHQLKEAILLALIHKMKTGEGSYVSVSLYEAAIAALANQASNYLMTGHIPQPMGTLHPNIAPYGEVFSCKDGKSMILSIGNDKQFRSLCTILGDPQLADDPAFQTNDVRVKNRASLSKALEPLFREHPSENLMAKLLSGKVPAAAIRDLREVFEEPVARGMVLTESLDDGTFAKCVKTVAFTSSSF